MTRVPRRTFLAAAAAGAAAIALDSCGIGGGRGGVSPPTGPPASPPAQRPYNGVRPDLPGTANGVPPAFRSYPADPPRLLSAPPGSGGSVSLLMEGFPAADLGKNHWWQALNAGLGVKLSFDLAPPGYYPSKLQIALATDGLADMVQITPMASLAGVLATDFADLTEHLSGDAVSEYPALAAIPTRAWAATTVAGRIWGVPKTQAEAGMILTYRGDQLAKLGLGNPQLRDGDDLMALLKEATDPGQRRWAIGEDPVTFVVPLVLEMLDAPNNWSMSHGKFVSQYESPQMKDALSLIADMWSKEYLHPQSFTDPTQGFAWWSSGVTSLYIQPFDGWTVYAGLHPDWGISGMPAPKWSGGGRAKKRLGPSATPSFVALKKAKGLRIQELLKLLDFIAAPFGTAEYLVVNYGAEGHDYTLDHGQISVNRSTSDSEQTTVAAAGSQIFASTYIPGQPDAVNAEHQFLREVLAAVIDDPTVGLYSDTALGVGAAAANTLGQAQSDIIQGRKKVSSWDSAVSAWKKKAGNKMAAEYEQAYAAAHP
jgi:putative aldouronate transport system substrate-binding protein